MYDVYNTKILMSLLQLTTVKKQGPQVPQKLSSLIFKIQNPPLISLLKPTEIAALSNSVKNVHIYPEQQR